MYLTEIGSYDVFVMNAMLFSILSVFISLFHKISRDMHMRRSCDCGNISGDDKVVRIKCRNENLFKMTIKWDKLKEQHGYVYSLIRQVLCLTVDIDDGIGWIEVIYIVLGAQTREMYVYFALERPPMMKLMTDNQDYEQEENKIMNKLKQIGKQGDRLNEFFKQEIAKGLKIKLKKKRIQINDNSQPGEPTTKVVSDMDITIESASTKMKFVLLN